ncbi:hypothetical protein IWQ57_003316, partial [Coemansia nantahalensis]
MGESIITSVTNQTAFARPHGDSGGDYLPAQTPLNVRGRRFVLDRETLNHLPESLLNTMFPNGLMPLGRGYDTYGYDSADYYHAAAGGSAAPEQTWVDFDPDMLAYMLQAYGHAVGTDLLAVAAPAAVPETSGSAGAGDHPDDSPAWLSYTSDGKASVAGVAGPAGGSGSGSGSAGAVAK